MRDEHWVEFLGLMAGLGEMFQVEVSPSLARGYWRALEDLSVEEFRRAIDRGIRELRRLPRPVELGELVRRGPTASALAWDLVLRAISQAGTYRSVAFEDPAIHLAIESMGGWIAFGQREENDWTRKDFERLHRAYLDEIARIGLVATRPRSHLPGRDEADGMTSRDPPGPVLIGDPTRIREWQAQLELEAPQEIAGDEPRVLQLVDAVGAGGSR